MEIRATSSLGTYPPGSFRAVLIPVPFRHRPHTKLHPRKVAKKCIFAKELIEEIVIGNPAEVFQVGGVVHVPSG